MRRIVKTLAIGVTYEVPYDVVQDGAMFAVRRGDGSVIATFSNKLAAETFADKQRAKDQDTPTPPPGTAS